MNANIVVLKVVAGCLGATLLAACASDSNLAPPAAADSASVAPPSAAAYNKLSKGLAGAQVRELIGAPATTKPLSAAGVTGQIWSYPLGTVSEVRSVPVGTKEIPATNLLTGQATTRSEPVYQNQTVESTDTLHLLMVDDRLIEWSIVRKENNQFN